MGGLQDARTTGVVEIGGSSRAATTTGCSKLRSSKSCVASRVATPAMTLPGQPIRPEPEPPPMAMDGRPALVAQLGRSPMESAGMPRGSAAPSMGSLRAQPTECSPGATDVVRCEERPNLPSTAMGGGRVECPWGEPN